LGRNILLITSDQQRYDSLGCNGGAIARTPVLDRLAAAGVNYHRAYGQNVTCTPARASIMTGQYIRTHGAVSCGRVLPYDSPSIAEYLASGAGYRTALIGKAHFEPAMDPFGRLTENRLAPAGSTGPLRGFQHVELAMHGFTPSLHYGVWLRSEHPDQVGSYLTPLSDGPSPTTGAPESRPNPIPRDLYHTEWVADRTLAYLDSLPENSDWFVWMSFPDPHHPWDPPEDEMRRVDWRDLDLPAGHPGGRAGIEKVLSAKPAHWLAYYQGRWSNYEGAPSRFVPARLSDDAIREVNARAHVMVELIDEACGRVLSRLRARGWEDRTDVFFTTDHGELQGDFGLLYKGPFHTDALMRLPFIWRPAPLANVVPAQIDEPVGQVDLAPTIAAVAGLPIPDWVEGRQLPTAAGADRDHMLCEWDSILPGYGMHLRTIYRQGWLCTAYEPSTINEPNGFETFLASLPDSLGNILNLRGPHPMGPQSAIGYGGSEGELYNLVDDPHQFVNLWDDPGYRRQRDELVEQLRASLPAPGPSLPVVSFA
jgi:arylsulfatase A-like enzyme